MAKKNTVDVIEQAPVTQTGSTTAVASTQTENVAEQVYKTFASKEDFDNHSAGAKGDGKKEAEKEMLALLGLTPDEKDKLKEYKEVYESKLSADEKISRNLSALQVKYDTLSKELADKDFEIAALRKLSGKTAEDVGTIVKMARGLVNDTVTTEQAIETVMSMITPVAAAQTDVAASAATNPSMPKGTTIVQPDITPPGESNPFTKETWNGSAQVAMYRANPEKAKILAEAAGVKIGW